MKCIVRKPSGFFAIDHDCGRLYEVTNENFGDWRERHDDQDDNKSSSESLAVPRSDVIDFTIVTPNGSNAAETAS